MKNGDEVRLVVLLSAAVLVLASAFCGALFTRLLFPTDARAYGSKGVGAIHWYFAEGYTGPGFEEWILVFNPPKEIGGSGRSAIVRLGYYGENGYITQSCIRVDPGKRSTIYVNEELEKVNYQGNVSTIVFSTDTNTPIICERAMYYNYKGTITGGSQVLGYHEGELE